MFEKFLSDSKFPVGQVVMTCGISEACANNETMAQHVLAAMRRHASGDWGDMCDEDKQANEAGLDAEHPGRLFSSYSGDAKGTKKVWVITEYDRSVTTVLFPDEY